ncbi:MAG: alpha/beta fold hydrolase [Bacteroidota bacterium]
MPPVVLVHGFLDYPVLLGRMRAHLEARGRTVYVPALASNTGRGGLERLSTHLATYLDATLSPGEPYDLVGLSMGGIVSRYVLQRLGGRDRARRFVSISAPHAGTVWARAPLTHGTAQMRPGSAFLRDLDRDVSTLAPLHPVSIWTPYDLTIVPGRSAVLPVGTSVPIPVPLHALMARDSRVLRRVAEALT